MPRPKAKKAKLKKQPEIDVRGWKDLTVDEVTCIICRRLLDEPITLPCKCRTRMRCSICRPCLRVMVSGERSTCNGDCPQCRMRLMSFFRKTGKDDYQGQINGPLWDQIRAQFKPHNPDGKESTVSITPVRHQFAETGEIHKEFLSGEQQQRAIYRRDREEEEEANLEILATNPEPEFEIEVQKRILEEIKNQSLREEQLKLDEQMAKRLAEESQYSLVKINQNMVDTSGDAEYARQLKIKELTVTAKPNIPQSSHTPQSSYIQPHSSSAIHSLSPDRLINPSPSTSTVHRKSSKSKVSINDNSRSSSSSSSSSIKSLSPTRPSKNGYKNVENDRKLQYQKRRSIDFKKSRNTLTDQSARDRARGKRESGQKNLSGKTSPPIKNYFRVTNMKRVRISSSDSTGSESNMNRNSSLIEIDSDSTPSPSSLLYQQTV